MNHNIINLYWRCEPVFPECFLPLRVILFSAKGWGTHQRWLIRALALSAMCLYPSFPRLCSNTCKKQLEGGKISFGSWFREYSPPSLEGMAARLALSMAAGFSHLCGTGDIGRGTLKPRGFLFFLCIQMGTQSALRINTSSVNPLQGHKGACH